MVVLYQENWKNSLEAEKSYEDILILCVLLCLPPSKLWIIYFEIMLKAIKNIFHRSSSDTRRIWKLSRCNLTLLLHPKTKLYNHLGFQFSDFQLRSFVDPKPVELWESYTANRIWSWTIWRFIKLDVVLAWLNIKFSSMAHLKQLSANFHLTIQKSQKSQGY